MKTACGVKDMYQNVFLDSLFNSYKSKCGKAAKQTALDAKFGTLPPNTTTPVWRIKGMLWEILKLQCITDVP